MKNKNTQNRFPNIDTSGVRSIHKPWSSDLATQLDEAHLANLDTSTKTEFIGHWVDCRKLTP